MASDCHIGQHREMFCWTAQTYVLVVSDVRRALIEVKFWHSLGGVVAQRLKCLPAMRETRVQSLGWEDPLEKDMATHSSILAQTHVHQVSDAIQPSHPLLSPSPPAFNLSQYQGLFQ